MQRNIWVLFWILFVSASINSIPEKHAWRKQKLLIDIYILLMVENNIRDRICNEIQWYVRTNNKYMKDYDTSKKFAYLMVCYECPLSQMLMTCGWFWIEKWQVYIWWTIHAIIWTDLTEGYLFEADVNPNKAGLFEG